MNTSGNYPVLVKLCDKCPDTFMRIGETDICLAFPRPPSKDMYGNPAMGTCPKHSQRTHDHAISG